MAGQQDSAISSVKLVELRDLLALVVEEAHAGLQALAEKLPGQPDQERCATLRPPRPATATVLVAVARRACDDACLQPGSLMLFACRKRALLLHFHATRQRLQRLRALVAWSNKARAAKECSVILQVRRCGRGCLPVLGVIHSCCSYAVGIVFRTALPAAWRLCRAPCCGGAALVLVLTAGDDWWGDWLTRAQETAAHNAALAHAADQLFHLHGELTYMAAPAYDVGTALHVLQTGAEGPVAAAALHAAAAACCPPQSAGWGAGQMPGC